MHTSMYKSREYVSVAFVLYYGNIEVTLTFSFQFQNDPRNGNIILLSQPLVYTDTDRHI